MLISRMIFSNHYIAIRLYILMWLWPTLQFRIGYIWVICSLTLWCFVKWRLIFYQESTIRIWLHWWVIVWTITNKCWSMSMSAKDHCLTICMVRDLNTSKIVAFYTNVSLNEIDMWWNDKLVLRLHIFVWGC